jgi:predicted transcriptional regulator
MGKNIILPIKSIYADRILSGIKTVEYRKNLFQRSLNDKIQQISNILIYACAPTKKVIGSASVKGIVISKSHINLWEATKELGGLTKKEFNDYYADNNDIATAIFIHNIVRFNTPLLLNQIRPGVRAPQGFIYITDLEYNRAQSLGNKVTK